MNFKLLNWIIPTPANGYRAKLLSNTALVIYTIILFLLNFGFGNIALGKTFALLDIGEIVALHNRERAQQGLPELEYNALLSDSAKLKGEVMLENDCWSHYCPPGKSPWDFFDSVGYDYRFAGENLAEGFTDNSAVMQAWMNSKSHRENVLKPEFTEIGVSIITGDFQGIRDNAIIVVHFGTAREGAPSPDTEISQTDQNNRDLEITQPENGAIIANPNPQISGETEVDEELEIIVNDRDQGRILPEGGIFTYKFEQSLPEGESVVSVNGIETGNSDTSSFTIDTTSPDIENESQFKAVSANVETLAEPGIVKFRYRNISETALDSVNLETEIGNYSGNQISNTEFEFEVNTQALTKGTPKLEVKDAAGNTSTAQLSKDLITQLNSEIKGISVQASPSASVSSQLSNFIAERGVFGIIVVSIIVGFVVLLFLDVTMIRKYEQESSQKIRSKSKFHLPALIILLFIVLIGNLSGSI